VKKVLKQKTVKVQLDRREKQRKEDAYFNAVKGKE
jgi:hypothetical protein